MTAPADTPEARAFFLGKVGGDKQRGAKNAGCFFKIWVPGKPKYGKLAPSGPSEWAAVEIVPLFAMASTDCSQTSDRPMPVTLKLEAPDRLVALRRDSLPGPRPAGEKPLAVWKRVVEKKPADVKAGKKPAAPKKP